MTAKAAQLSSLRLGQPLGQSGLLGNPPLERHQSRHARGKVEMRIIAEQTAPNNTTSWFSLHPVGGVKGCMFEVMLTVKYGMCLKDKTHRFA